ncbi:hypothetical protein B0H13DRAFT_1887131 [Mycena leptocephala]|nr:hypothetical protein B0H13DRAFT_1887131 [Mycena leptocephala]
MSDSTGAHRSMASRGRGRPPPPCSLGAVSVHVGDLSVAASLPSDLVLGLDWLRVVHTFNSSLVIHLSSGPLALESLNLSSRVLGHCPPACRKGALFCIEPVGPDPTCDQPTCDYGWTTAIVAVIGVHSPVQRTTYEGTWLILSVRFNDLNAPYLDR